MQLKDYNSCGNKYKVQSPKTVTFWVAGQLFVYDLVFCFLPLAPFRHSCFGGSLQCLHDKSSVLEKAEYSCFVVSELGVCVHVCVCACLCVHACMYMNMCTCMSVCMHVCISVCFQKRVAEHTLLWKEKGVQPYTTVYRVLHSTQSQCRQRPRPSRLSFYHESHCTVLRCDNHYTAKTAIP